MSNKPEIWELELQRMSATTLADYTRLTQDIADIVHCDKCAKARKTAGGQWHCVEHGELDI